MHLPLSSRPNNLLTALANQLNSLPCASCPLMPSWKTILSRSAAIKAEARSRVYWTNVLIDPKVSVDIFLANELSSRLSRRAVEA
jgi:hypothetical protein